MKKEKNLGWLCPLCKSVNSFWITRCNCDQPSTCDSVEDIDGFDYTEYSEWDKCWYAVAKSGFSCKAETPERAKELLLEKLK